MIETVNLVSIRGRSCVENLEERLVGGCGQVLHLHIDVERARHVENFGQLRDRLSVWQPYLGNFDRANGGNGAMTWKIGIVVHHDDVVTGSVNVQLDAVRALIEGSSEGGEGVFVMLA
jgi:hypothetical protein